MKLMIRKDSKGVLTGYVPKKDLEEAIVSMVNPGMWGGLVTLANGYRFAARGSGTEPKMKFYLLASEKVGAAGRNNFSALGVAAGVRP